LCDKRIEIKSVDRIYKTVVGPEKRHNVGQIAKTSRPTVWCDDDEMVERRAQKRKKRTDRSV